MSDRPIIKGLDAAIKRVITRDWSREQGETKSERYEGPDTKVEALYASLIGNEDLDSMSFEKENGKGELTITIVDNADDISPGTSAEENAIWWLTAQDVFLDLRQHPYFSPTISTGMISELLQADEAIKRGEILDTTGFTYAAQAKRYFGLRRAGVEGYNSEILVLHKKLTTSRRTIAVASYDGVGKVTDLNAISPPTTILGDLKQLPKIPLLRDYDPEYPPFESAQYEWLKKFPSVVPEQGGRRFAIEETWWGADKWAIVLYPGGTWDPGLD